MLIRTIVTIILSATAFVSSAVQAEGFVRIEHNPGAVISVSDDHDDAEWSPGYWETVGHRRVWVEGYWIVERPRQQYRQQQYYQRSYSQPRYYQKSYGRSYSQGGGRYQKCG